MGKKEKSSQVSDGGLIPGQTGQLTVGHMITTLTLAIFQPPCGGESEYLHHNPVSRKRWQKGYPVPGGITVAGGYKYGDLGLQVGEVVNETVKYGYGSCLTWTTELFQCELRTCPLAREGTLHKEGCNCRHKEIKIWSSDPKRARHQDGLLDTAPVNSCWTDDWM
jgi:hypothetical protein